MVFFEQVEKYQIQKKINCKKALYFIILTTGNKLTKPPVFVEVFPLGKLTVFTREIDKKDPFAEKSKKL